jgi:hypothetical protein
MRLLHEDEFSCIQYLLEKTDKTITLTYSEIEYSGYFDVHKAQEFLLTLHKHGLIVIESSWVDHSAYFMDTLLRRYFNLVKKDVNEAKKMVTPFKLEPLNKLLIKQKSIEETWAIFDELFSKEGDMDMLDTNFSIDLYDAINLKIKVKKDLQIYLDKYLETFKNDGLIIPDQPKEDWAKVTYFENEFYRYKKQNEILFNLIAKKIETQPPLAIHINIKEDLPTNHINLNELIACFKQDGIIISSKYEYLGKQGYDLVLSVAEEKVNHNLNIIKPELSKIKLNPKLVTQNGVGYLKFSNQDKKIKIGGIGTRKYRLLEILIEPLGVARTIESIFENIGISRDKVDSRLRDTYLSKERKREIIEYAMKELQKIEGLKSRVKLGFSNNKNNAWLIIDS